MSAYPWINLGVAAFSWTLEEKAIPFKSVFGSQALVVGSPTWSVEMTGLPLRHADAGRFRLFVEQLAGYRHQVALWDLSVPQPKGTLRGTLVLVGAHAQGSTSLLISGGSTQAGKTLLAGDRLGLGSGVTQQVLPVIADATADSAGEIVVSVGVPLRNGFSDGAAVEWDRPKALFRQRELAAPLTYVPGATQAWTLSLFEDWRP
jgi:hypothetical protein